MAKKILYIDDDKLDVESSSYFFKMNIEGKIEDELVFTIKDNTFWAIEALKKDIFDAIICDGHLLYGNHGREVIEFIKAYQADQLSKVIIYSSDKKFVDDCKEQGMKWCSKSLSTYENINNELCAILKNNDIYLL